MFNVEILINLIHVGATSVNQVFPLGLFATHLYPSPTGRSRQPSAASNVTRPRHPVPLISTGTDMMSGNSPVEGGWGVLRVPRAMDLFGLGDISWQTWQAHSNAAGPIQPR